jgi:hypothetical protein
VLGRRSGQKCGVFRHRKERRGMARVARMIHDG